MTEFPFTKMTGTGNDFIFIDARGKDFPSLDRALFSKSLCRRYLSVGADGVVFIETSSNPAAAFKWDFYNSDGSEAEMCGNASRCVARYAVEKKISKSPVKFETRVGLVEARVTESSIVEVDLQVPKVLEKNVKVPIGEHIKLDAMVVNSGVPHIVRENDDWDEEYIHDLGGHLRRHELFKKFGGANCTFYEVTGENAIESATFERGVEAVTLACGTGAVAAAFAAVQRGQVKSPVDVRVPGGKLQVKIDSEKVTLTGEARFICEGKIKSEALL